MNATIRIMIQFCDSINTVIQSKNTQGAKPHSESVTKVEWHVEADLPWASCSSSVSEWQGTEQAHKWSVWTEIMLIINANASDVEKAKVCQFSDVRGEWQLIVSEGEITKLGEEGNVEISWVHSIQCKIYYIKHCPFIRLRASRVFEKAQNLGENAEIYIF